ncbi:MAG: hypothetical protein DCC43_11920 [Candidatus Brocadia sp.]|nr:hypothetical protein [Candidatus Brocadia sp.]MCE7912622.1 hypothetical protein [Candidatus Brocadia sp. AMX3]MDG5998045.1 hypothetical protein [Candidatus Brocadia sp.]RIJ94886.1 MAG: hypothetical protein DCC43_11920 [Candidatus Brocadia sp.]
MKRKQPGNIEVQGRGVISILLFPSISSMRFHNRPKSSIVILAKVAPFPAGCNPLKIWSMKRINSRASKCGASCRFWLPSPSDAGIGNTTSYFWEILIALWSYNMTEASNANSFLSSGKRQKVFIRRPSFLR